MTVTLIKTTWEKFSTGTKFQREIASVQIHEV